MTHSDIWIFEDLKTIAIYYPEIAPEYSILNTQTVFVDYETAANKEKQNFLDLLGRSDYDLPGRCVKFLEDNNITDVSRTPKKYISGPDAWVKKMQQWGNFLTETKTKPGNVIFHPDFYDKVFHTYERYVASPSYEGQKVTSFEYKSWIDPSITFKFRIDLRAGLGGLLAGFDLKKQLIGLEDDEIAKLHCPLSYFPTKINFNSVLYNPSEKEKEREKFIDWYGDIGKQIADFCDNKNRKILYKDVVSTSGNYGYDISVDLHNIGMDLKYDLRFESYLLKFLDPELFFVHKAQRVFLDKVKSDYGHLSSYKQMVHKDFSYRVISQDKMGNARIEFPVWDTSLWDLRYPVEQLKVRDNYIQAFLAGFRIPIETPRYRLDPADYVVLDPINDYVSKKNIDFGYMIGKQWRDIQLPQLYPIYLEHHDKSVLEIIGEIFEHAVSFAIRSLSGDVLGAFIAEVSSIIQEQINKGKDVPEIIKIVSKVGFVELSSRFAADSKSKTSDTEKQKIETRKKVAEIAGKVGHSWIVGDQQDQEELANIEEFADRLLEEGNKRTILILAEIANQKEAKLLSEREKRSIALEKFLDTKRGTGEGISITTEQAKEFISRSKSDAPTGLIIAAAAIGLALLFKKK